MTQLSESRRTTAGPSLSDSKIPLIRPLVNWRNIAISPAMPMELLSWCKRERTLGHAGKKIPRIVNALVQGQGRTRWVCGPGFAPAVVIGALMRSTVQEWGPRGAEHLLFDCSGAHGVHSTHHTFLPPIQTSRSPIVGCRVTR